MANPNGGLMITPQLIKLTGVQDGAHKIFNKPGKCYIAVAKDALKHFDDYTAHRFLINTINKAVIPWEYKHEVKLDAIYDHGWEFILQERVY